MITGRQLVWIVNHAHRIDVARGAMFDIRDLQSCTLASDSQMANFLADWEYKLQGLNEEPTSHTKMVYFFEAIKHSKALALDLAHWDRLDMTHADRSYEWLLQRVCAHLDRTNVLCPRRSGR